MTVGANGIHQITVLCVYVMMMWELNVMRPVHLISRIMRLSLLLDWPPTQFLHVRKQATLFLDVVIKVNILLDMSFGPRCLYLMKLLVCVSALTDQPAMPFAGNYTYNDHASSVLLHF